MSQCRLIRILRKIVVHRCQNCPALVAGVSLIRSRHDPGIRDRDDITSTPLLAADSRPGAGEGRARAGSPGEGGWPGDILP